MPLIPNIIERTLFFEFNEAPGPLLDNWSAIAFRTVLAGIRVGLFETLDEEIMSAEMLAKKLNLNEKGAVTLLETLRSLGYLKKKGNGYINSAMTSKWLVNSSGMDRLISNPNRYYLLRGVSGLLPINTHYALGSHANGKLVIDKREPQSQDQWKWSNS